VLATSSCGERSTRWHVEEGAAAGAGLRYWGGSVRSVGSARVAQLDRALASEAKGRRFESRRARFKF
jgi:hypothetical protein